MGKSISRPEIPDANDFSHASCPVMVTREAVLAVAASEAG